MVKEIKYSREAMQNLKKLDRNLKLRVIAKINLLATNPAALANNIKKLQGIENGYRLRVGNYRVIYTEDLEIIAIKKISPRGKAYP